MVFSTHCAKTIRYPYPFLIPYTKTNSKRIINLSMRAKIIKVIEENIGENLCHLESGKDS